jgi:cysteine desulfurase / selenocysteine lyase
MSEASASDTGHDWVALRARFPATSKYLYADSAAVGALPQDAVDTAAAAFARLAEEGMLGYGALKQEAETVRAAVAGFFGAAAADIGFTDCTSTSMNLLAMMAKQEWEKGGSRRDEVVMPKGEFPSSTLGWLHQGFKPRWVRAEPDLSYPVEKILEAVGPRTRVVVTSQVQYQTGLRLEVEQLSHELAGRGVWHVVNCTQSAGVVPQHVAANGFSAVTATAVKWLCSGLGTGIVYLSEALRQECRLPVAGWLAQRNPFAMISDEVQLKDEASGLETGATDVVRLLVLGTNIALMEGIGREAVHARVLALNGRLLAGFRALGEELLTPTDDAARAGIVSVRHRRAREWSSWAKAKGVLHSVRGDDVLRFSLHYFNNEDDVERLLATWPEGPKSM